MNNNKMLGLLVLAYTFCFGLLEQKLFSTVEKGNYQEMIIAASVNSFVDTTFLDFTICEEDSISFNGTYYHIDNPTGTYTYSDSLNGDSVLIISLDFLPTAFGVLDTTLCFGDSLSINETIYNENNLQGLEIFDNASIDGCDSLVQVMVSYYVLPLASFDTLLCQGSTLSIGDVFFDENNLAGTVTLENANSNGCDSLIEVSISFLEVPEGMIDTILCPGENLELHGTIFDPSNLTGILNLAGTSSKGCDSLLNVLVSYYPEVHTVFTDTICGGNYVTINSVNYSETGTYTEIINGGTYTGCDSLITLNLFVKTAPLLGLSNAGENASECINESVLMADLPENRSGFWTTNTLDAFIADPQNPITSISNLAPGNNLFFWTLSSPQCSNYHVDTVNVLVELTPIAYDDSFLIPYNAGEIALNLIENDDLVDINSWHINLLSLPNTGTLEGNSAGIVLYEAPIAFNNSTLDFQYSLCNVLCLDYCDSAFVNLELEPEPSFIDSTINVANAITPNEDGINDYFIFNELLNDPDQYPDNELLIFNRWGSIVFQTKPYHNNWNGQNKKGQFLPAGTYYYIMRLDLAKGLIYRGDITILR